MSAASLPEDGELRIGPVGLPAGKRIRAKTWSTRPEAGRVVRVGFDEQPVAWVTREAVPDSGRAWAALSEAQQDTGLVPFLLGTLLGDVLSS
jgi:hypothetical protein